MNKDSKAKQSFDEAMKKWLNICIRSNSIPSSFAMAKWFFDEGGKSSLRMFDELQGVAMNALEAKT